MLLRPGIRSLDYRGLCCSDTILTKNSLKSQKQQYVSNFLGPSHFFLTDDVRRISNFLIKLDTKSFGNDRSRRAFSDLFSIFCMSRTARSVERAFRVF